MTETRPIPDDQNLALTDEQLSKLQLFLKREDLRYQSFDLPDGMKTPGHDRAYLEKIIFRDDVRGESFLDIGSYLGYFCLAALRHGASAATGLEANPESVRKSREFADILGRNPEYLAHDFETWDPGDRRFDHVLCLNVMHHMFDAVHSLRRMMTLARKRVVLEVARLTWRDYKFGFFNPLALALNSEPLIYLGAPKKKSPYNIASRSFLFTPAAMKTLFNMHSALFEPIAITPSPFKGRYIVEARRRSIGHLVAVAGVTSSGKTTLAERLMRDPDLRHKLGLADGDWKVVKLNDVASLPSGHLPNVIVQYDLMLASGSDVQGFERIPAFQLMDAAERFTTLTIVPPSGRLKDQMNEKEIARLRKKVGPDLTNALMDLYSARGDTAPIKAIYRDWLGYCERHAVNRQESRIVVNDFADFEPHALDSFEDVFDAVHKR